MKRADYHVHHYVDYHCADKSMTFENIINTANEVHIEEICVVKHVTQWLPDGSDYKWANWAKLVPEQFELFLSEYKAADKKGVNVLIGAETELLDEEGKVNILPEDAAKLDMLNLSCHWIPQLSNFKVSPWIVPLATIEKLKAVNAPQEQIQAYVDMYEEIKAIGLINIIESLVRAYINAIDRNPKVRNLAHMYDGLFPFIYYNIPLDQIRTHDVVEIMEPLFAKCVEKQVLWEICRDPNATHTRLPVLQRAAEVGVKFTPTTDAHFIKDGWANLVEYQQIVDQVTRWNLPLGNVVLEVNV